MKRKYKEFPPKVWPPKYKKTRFRLFLDKIFKSPRKPRNKNKL